MLEQGNLNVYHSETAKEFSASVPADALTKLESSSNDPRVFSITTAWGKAYKFRAPSPAEAGEWLTALRAAADVATQHAQQARAAAAASGGQQLAAVTGVTPASRDSDESDDEGFATPVPQWMHKYDDSEEQDRVADATLWVMALFEVVQRQLAEVDMYQDEATPAITREQQVRVFTDGLAAATSELQDRVAECKLLYRPDVMKVFIRAFDVQVLTYTGQFVNGDALREVPPPALLRLSDAVDAYLVVRVNALRDVLLSVEDDSEVARTLLCYTRDIAAEYMLRMGPALSTIADRIKAKLLADRERLMEQVVGTRLGSNSPQRFFGLVSETLAIVRTGGSRSLQRQLLCKVLEVVLQLARDLVADVRDVWRSSPESLNMDYLIGLVNDLGGYMDHLERLESDFHSAIQDEAQHKADMDETSSVSSATSWHGQLDDLQQREGVRVDVDFSGDLPRTIQQLKSCGIILTRTFAEMVLQDVGKDLAELFTSTWKGVGPTSCSIQVATISQTLKDYLDDATWLLEPYWLQRASGFAYAQLQTQVLHRFVAWARSKTSTRKLTEERVQLLSRDIHLLNENCKAIMPDTDRQQLLAPLRFLGRLCHENDDDWLAVVQAFLDNRAPVAVHYSELFDCFLHLTNFSKAERGRLMHEAHRLVARITNPESALDYTMVVHNASNEWVPACVGMRCMHTAFPEVLDRLSELLQAAKDANEAGTPSSSASKPSVVKRMFGFSWSSTSAATRTPAPTQEQQSTPAPAPDADLTAPPVQLSSFADFVAADKPVPDAAVHEGRASWPDFVVASLDSPHVAPAPAPAPAAPAAAPMPAATPIGSSKGAGNPFGQRQARRSAAKAGRARMFSEDSD